MASLSGFKIALIGLVLFMGLSAGGLVLYTYLNGPEASPRTSVKSQAPPLPKNGAETTPPTTITTTSVSKSPPVTASSTTTTTTIKPAPITPQRNSLAALNGENSRPPGIDATPNPAPGGLTPQVADDWGLPRPPTRSSATPITPTSTGASGTSFQPPNPLDRGGIISQAPGDNSGTPANGPLVPESLLRNQPPGYNPNGGSTVFNTPAGGRRETMQDRFLFNNLALSAITGNKVTIKTGTDTDINAKKFAPRGEEVPVAAAVWYDFYYQRNLLLPVGTKLLGTAGKGKFRNRLSIRFERAIFTNGKSISLTGLGLDQDGTVGIPGQLIGNVLLDSLGPLLLQAGSDIANRLKDRQQQLLTSTTSGFFGSTQTQSTQLVETNDTKNALLDASTNALQKINQLVSQDIEENKPYVLVPAGTRLRIRLMASMDISGADYGK
jgi:hypothetical protein